MTIAVQCWKRVANTLLTITLPIAATIGAPLTAGSVALAQTYLSSRSEQSDAPFVAGFRRGLAESGGNVDQRATIEFRWGDNEPSRLEKLAAELITIRPVVIVAGGGAGTALVLKKLTNTIPIVFINGADPVKTSLECKASAGPRRTSPG